MVETKTGKLFGICGYKSLRNRGSHRKCSAEKMFLEMSQNSQENTCA